MGLRKSERMITPDQVKSVCAILNDGFYEAKVVEYYYEQATGVRGACIGISYDGPLTLLDARGAGLCAHG